MGKTIVATKGVGHLKGCGVVFSDLFFWGVDRQKVGTPLKKTLKCKHGSWIHGSRRKTFHQEIMLMMSCFDVEFHGL